MAPGNEDKANPLNGVWKEPARKEDSIESDESMKGLIRGPEGPNGNLLTRQDTATCTGCSGVRIISCARVGWTPFSCGKRDAKPSKIVIALITTTFIISVIGTIILFFTDAFSSTVLTNMVIKPNSSAYDLWKNPPIHPLMKIHILNYTNVDQVMEGTAKKFHVEDVGPYVYRETITRVNEVFNDNGTLTFQEKKSYQFLPKHSFGSQYDNVTVPNLPFLTAMAMVQNSYYLTKVGMSTLFQTLQTTAFRSLPVDRFLWGYDDDLITLAQPYLAMKGDLPYKKFGVLVTKRGISKDRVTINTGERNIKKIGIIDKYNGVDKLPHWGTDECNRVDGSDGSVFPASMIDGKQPLYVFNKELCRRFPFVFEKKVKIFNDIPTWRYSPPKDVFDDPSTNFANQCYCHIDSAACPPKGVFNSSPCAFGAPAFASFPHFYLGDTNLINSIEGLNPDPEKHRSYIDIHPDLGFPIGVSSKMQINIQVRTSEGLTGYDFLKNDLILPVAWLDVTVEELPPEIKNLIYHGTFSVHQVHLVLSIICIILLIVTSLGMVFIIRSWWLYNERKC